MFRAVEMECCNKCSKPVYKDNKVYKYYKSSDLTGERIILCEDCFKKLISNLSESIIISINHDNSHIEISIPISAEPENYIKILNFYTLYNEYGAKVTNKYILVSNDYCMEFNCIDNIYGVEDAIKLFIMHSKIFTEE